MYRYPKKTVTSDVCGSQKHPPIRDTRKVVNSYVGLNRPSKELMNLSLSPELAQFVQTKVASGTYSSESEVALAGLSLLKDIDALYQGRYEELREQVAQGVAEAERGELIDSEQVFRKLRTKLNHRRNQN